MFKVHWFTAAVLIASCAPAIAQHTVQERMAVMDAQLELLKKKGQLDKALQESAGSSLAALPQILAVMGLEGVMLARLQLSDGAVNTYRVGETIRPGMAVVSITPRQVSVSVGGHKAMRAVPLEFIAGAAPAGQAGFAPLPGGRAPVPKELLPEPPPVRLPAVATPAAAPSAAPVVAPAAAPGPIAARAGALSR